MTLRELIRRGDAPLIGWADADKIPWDEPAFSARMLREHLTDAHDRASRRAARIERQVAWIDGLLEQPSQILDLGCGPGLYTSRLAQRGHRCVGIDFSPASIAHAREISDCEYRLADLREADFGGPFDLVLLIFGELNAFRRDEGADIVARAAAALAPDGAMLLEVHDQDFVRNLGRAGRRWFTADQGLFSDQPHLCLIESGWDEAQRAAVERFDVIASDGAVTRMASTLCAYSDAEYEALLLGAGLTKIERHAGLGDPHEGLFAIVARR